MTFSGRYSWALVFLCALALLPMWLREENALGNDPCRTPGALLDVGSIPDSTALGQQLEALDEDVIQWSLGFVGKRSDAMNFQVIRSFNARSLYENPTDWMIHEIEPEEHAVIELVSRGVRLPVHLMRDGAQRPARMAAYLFVYGNDPVETPFTHALRSSAVQFFRGTRPLTAIAVEAPTPRRIDARTEDRAAAWIAAAWELYQRSCTTGGAGVTP